MRVNGLPVVFCSATCSKASWYREKCPPKERLSRQCEICKNGFIPDIYHPNKVVCGKACSKKLDYKRHQDSIIVRINAWRKANPERLRKYQRKYYWGNVKKKRAEGRLRQRGHISLSQWETICDEYGNKCNHCGMQSDYTLLTIDHVRPISKGGTNDIGNLQPLCITCNQSKGNRFVG
jgi:5-methylcytosine-specific restriction endonuclease McrA